MITGPVGLETPGADHKSRKPTSSYAGDSRKRGYAPKPDESGKGQLETALTLTRADSLDRPCQSGPAPIGCQFADSGHQAAMRS